jgi:hypothetical protein
VHYLHVTNTVCGFIICCPAGSSFHWLAQDSAASGIQQRVVATATAAATYNEKAVVFFQPQRTGEASVATSTKDMDTERLLRQVAADYHTLLLQSGVHVVHVFE